MPRAPPHLTVAPESLTAHQGERGRSYGINRFILETLASSYTQSAALIEDVAATDPAALANPSAVVRAFSLTASSEHILLTRGMPDEPSALQDALATNTVDAIVVVPAGFGEGCLAAAHAGEELPQVEIAYGGYTQASVLAEQQAVRWVQLAGAAAALEPDADVARVAELVEVAAAERADTEVVDIASSRGPSYPLQAYLSFSSYTIVCSVVVCVGLVLTKMGTPGVRRRMLVALAFMLAQLGFREEGLNALGNLGGMVSSFLGGAWVPIAMLGEAVQMAARFSPAYWTNDAVEAALAAPEVTVELLARLGADVGVALLFAVAFTAVGLAVNRTRTQE